MVATWSKYANARAKGIQTKIEVLTEDARKLSISDARFDVVVSIICIHSNEPKLEQAPTCQKIARVLKPGGLAVIGKYVPTRSYAESFRQAGLTNQFRSMIIAMHLDQCGLCLPKIC